MRQKHCYFTELLLLQLLFCLACKCSDSTLQSAKSSCSPHSQALVATLGELYASVDLVAFHHHMTISHVMRLRVHCIYKFPVVLGAFDEYKLRFTQ